MDPPAAQPAQMIIVPAPVVAPNCVAYSDSALRVTKGALCTSQYVTRNITKSE